MNERIRELAEKAWEEVLSETSIDGDSSNVYSPDEVVAFEQKFAELIVKECGQYLNSPEFIGRSDLDWSMVLNEHFGVE